MTSFQFSVVCVTFPFIFLFSLPSRLAWQQMKPMALFGESRSSHQPLLQPGYPKSIWTSPNNVAMSPYTWQVLRYSAHVLYHAGTPLPSIPLPTHSEQSKPRAQAGQTVTILQVWAQMKRSLGNTLNVCVWLIHTYRAITRPQLTWDREVLYRDCTTLKNFIDAPSH